MKPQIVNSKMNKMLIKNKLMKTAMLIFAAIMVTVMTGSLYFQDRVLITDMGVTKELMTSETDVYEILKFGEYSLGEYDTVSYSNVDESTAHITINRAFNVYVKADGKTVAVPVTEGTVSSVLEKAGVTLGEKDICSEKPDAEVYENMTINIVRYSYELTSDTTEIPYKTRYVDNSNLTIGTEKVITEGKNGSVTNIIKKTYFDDVLDKTEILTTYTVEPREMVIERGTAFASPYAKMSDPQALKLVNGIPQNYTRIVSGKSTAYTAAKGARTASGRYAVIGTVAVNPNVIPYGSELYIVSQDHTKVYGYAIAADTGLGLMDGTVAVDLYFGDRDTSYRASCNWGAVMVDIYVISEGSGY